jgi:hypothetical protein
MRLVRASTLAWWVRVVGASGAAVTFLSFAPSAVAQSAADKATARTLATDGIKLFQAGRYAEALDRLQRAQALYDAPVHLLYIARTQVKLDKLVEGAETYRRLARVQLEAGAAPAQKQAVEAAGPELAELEPRIPALRLELEPANLSGIDIHIDGERVPPAIVGVDRPANPGTHTVQVSAQGYNPAEQTIELKAGEKKPVVFRLEAASGASAGAPVPGAAPGAPAGGMATAPAADGRASAAARTKKKIEIGFMVGLRLGAAVPFGDVGITPDYDDTQPLSDFVQSGGGGELRAGVRFLKYFTGLLYFGNYVVKPGVFWDDAVEALTADVHADNKASAQEAGFGLMVAFPRGKFGPFGELDFAFHRRFQVDQEFSISSGLGRASCDLSWKLTGAGVRLLGGVQIPVASFFQLSPYAGFTVGKAPDKWEADGECSELGGFDELPIEDPKSNGLFVIGVGGDFLFGNDTP